MAQGHTAAQVANAFTTSHENLANEVTQEYASILHRAVEPAGLANGVKLLARGTTVTDLDASLLKSPEYLIAHPTAGESVSGGIGVTGGIGVSSV